MYTARARSPNFALRCLFRDSANARRVYWTVGTKAHARARVRKEFNSRATASYQAAELADRHR